MTKKIISNLRSATDYIVHLHQDGFSCHICLNLATYDDMIFASEKICDNMPDGDVLMCDLIAYFDRDGRLHPVKPIALYTFRREGVQRIFKHSFNLKADHELS